MPLPFPLFVQRDLRRTHSACQQQPHPKGPSGCRHRSVVESIITQYMIGPMYSLPVEHEARRQTAEGQQRSGPLTAAPHPPQARQLCDSLKKLLGS